LSIYAFTHSFSPMIAWGIRPSPIAQIPCPNTLKP
jgi:hypothetical protein